MHLGTRVRTSIALLVGLILLTATTAVGAVSILPAKRLAADAVIMGTDGPDNLVGGEAGESIYGRAGDDVINGGGGDDELDGGPGADVFIGGPGVDVVSYAGPAGVAGVSVAIDGIAADGIPGEGDNVGLDVEDLYGGESDDKLTGSAAANTIDGAGGSDRIDGGPGPDVLIGGPGADTIEARDGEVDRIECGPGPDVVSADEDDVVADDCESVSTPKVTIRPELTLIKSSRRMIVSSVVSKSSLKIVCYKGCKGTVVKRKSVSLKKGTVRLKLPKKIAGSIIEVGATAPESSTTCVRFKVSKRYLVKRDKKACTTDARLP